jgi:hypothetical protein
MGLRLGTAIISASKTTSLAIVGLIDQPYSNVGNVRLTLTRKT